MKKANDLPGKIVRSAEASMRAEGFSVSTRAKRDCHAMLNGKVSADTLVQRYVDNYKK